MPRRAAGARCATARRPARRSRRRRCRCAAGRPARRSGGRRPTATPPPAGRAPRRATRPAGTGRPGSGRPRPAVTPSSLRCSTSIVRRRADSQVAGSSVASTGSSLYSRPMTSHRSMPARSMRPGSTSSRRWVSQRSRTSACSRSGSGTVRVGSGATSVMRVSEAEIGRLPARADGALQARRRWATSPARGRRFSSGSGDRARGTHSDATRSRPCCFASYMAASARSTSRHRASVGVLAVHRPGQRDRRSRRSPRARRRCGWWRPPSGAARRAGRASSGSPTRPRTTSSSPPVRARTSAGRTVAVSDAGDRAAGRRPRRRARGRR